MRIVTALIATVLLSIDASAQDNKAIARRYFDEILNKGSMPAIDAIIAPDVVFRNPPAVIKGIEEFRKLVTGLRATFPDLHFALEDEFGEGGKVATRWVMRGSNKTVKMDVSGMDIFLIADGKIREIWVSMDSLAQARQMGQLPGK